MDKKQQRLWSACHARDEEAVFAALEEGVDPKCADESGITPLMIAVGSGLGWGAMKALARRSDLLARGEDGSTVMHWAARSQDPLALEWARDHVELTVLTTSTGQSPVEIAARHHWSDGVQVMFPLAASHIKGSLADLAKSCLSASIERGLSEPGRLGWSNRLESMRAVSAGMQAAGKRFGEKMIERLEGEAGLSHYLELVQAEREAFDVILRTLWPALSEAQWLEAIESVSSQKGVKIDEAKAGARSFAAERCKEFLNSHASEASAAPKRDPSI